MGRTNCTNLLEWKETSEARTELGQCVLTAMIYKRQRNLTSIAIQTWWMHWDSNGHRSPANFGYKSSRDRPLQKWTNNRRDKSGVVSRLLWFSSNTAHYCTIAPSRAPESPHPGVPCISLPRSSQSHHEQRQSTTRRFTIKAATQASLLPQRPAKRQTFSDHDRSRLHVTTTRLEPSRSNAFKRTSVPMSLSNSFKRRF